MEKVNKDLRLQHLEKFSSKITESDRERVEKQDEEKDLFDRHTGIDKANHDILFYLIFSQKCCHYFTMDVSHTTLHLQIIVPEAN